MPVPSRKSKRPVITGLIENVRSSEKRAEMHTVDLKAYMRPYLSPTMPQVIVPSIRPKGKQEPRKPICRLERENSAFEPSRIYATLADHIMSVAQAYLNLLFRIAEILLDCISPSLFLRCSRRNFFQPFCIGIFLVFMGLIWELL